MVTSIKIDIFMRVTMRHIDITAAFTKIIFHAFAEISQCLICFTNARFPNASPAEQTASLNVIQLNVIKFLGYGIFKNNGAVY